MAHSVESGGRGRGAEWVGGGGGDDFPGCIPG